MTTLLIHFDNATGRYFGDTIQTTDIDDYAVASGKIASGGVNRFNIGSGQIVSGGLGAGAIISANLASGGIGNLALARGSILSAQIGANIIAGPHIANYGIVSANINSGAINQFSLGSGAVVSGNIGAGTIISANIASGAVGSLAHAAASFLSTHFGSGQVASAHLASSFIGNITVANGAVTSSKIAANAIGAIHIINQGLASANYASGSIGLPHIGNSAIASAQAGANVLGGIHIFNQSLLSANYGAASIGSPHILSPITGLTLTSPTINGTIATTGLTMPAFKLSGSFDANNQTFTNPGIGLPKIIRKTADETVNNSTVLQNDDELLFAMAANEVWEIEVNIRATSPTLGGTPGLKTAAAMPTGCTSSDWILSGLLDGTYAQVSTINGAGTSSFIEAAATTYTVQIWKCIVVNGANAGNWQFQWAQNTATVENTKVKANSYIIGHRLL